MNHRQSIVLLYDLYTMSTVGGLKSTDVFLWCTNCTSAGLKIKFSHTVTKPHTSVATGLTVVERSEHALGSRSNSE